MNDRKTFLMRIKQSTLLISILGGTCVGFSLFFMPLWASGIVAILAFTFIVLDVNEEY